MHGMSRVTNLKTSQNWAEKYFFSVPFYRKEMKIHLVLACILFTKILLGQSFHEIQIIDKDDKTPIPYVTIVTIDKSSYQISDKNGKVVLNSEFLKDSIEVLHIGYQSKKILLQNTSSQTVELKSSEHQLSSIEIQGKVLQKNVLKVQGKGSKSGKYSSFRYAHTYIKFARFFKNLSRKTGYIDEIALLIHNKKELESNFNIWIYSNKDSLPYLPLTDKVTIQAHAKNGWQKINLTEKKILLPEHGFWVVVEIAETNPNAFIPDWYSIQDTSIENSNIWKKHKENGKVTGYWRPNHTGIITEKPKSYICNCAEQRYDPKKKVFSAWTSILAPNRRPQCPKMKATLRW